MSQGEVGDGERDREPRALTSTAPGPGTVRGPSSTTVLLKARHHQAFFWAQSIPGWTSQRRQESDACLPTRADRCGQNAVARAHHGGLLLAIPALTPEGPLV